MTDSSEDQDLMLSGIQHFQFCKRQWALIHIEQQWEENVRTIEGQHIHQKADQPFVREKRNHKFVVRAMPVRSNYLNVSGICDVVEFIEDEGGVPIQNSEEKFKAIPVEYKRGKPKKDLSDILQLTAQAMCIEEMLLTEVEVGYLFYNEVKRREEVLITQENRDKVEQMFKEMQHYFDKRHTPKVKTGAFCKSCSLQHICLPRLMSKESVSAFIERNLSE